MKKAVFYFFSTMRAAYLRGGTAQIIRCLFSPFAFYLYVSAKNAQIILVFFCGCFLSVSDASSPPTNDIHICEVFDYEDMRARDSLYAATKQALNLNVGEPRTVRMIYFLPNDRPFQQAVVDSMKVTIRQIQTFYAEQMEARGYGRKTFRFETDAQGEPVVHHVYGQHPDSRYIGDTVDTVLDEIEQAFDVRENVYFFVVDNSTNKIGQAAGSARLMGKNGGVGFVPVGFHWTTAAHELGHTFDLRHDFRDEAYIMSYGKSRRGSLSACHAEFLSMHPYFNPDIPTEEAQPPTIELVSQTGYPAGSKSISVQLKVSDSDGLHQVILFITTIPPHSATGSYEVKSCRGLAGESDAIVEFDYDGVIPSDSGTSFSDPPTHQIYVEAVDSFGNAGNTRFELFDLSTQGNLIATLEGHRGRVNSVAFSPDGTTLASGSWDPSIKLWDVATRTNIVTRTRFTRGVYSVAFSPDGGILASGSGDRVTHLWDVATRAMITTLQGHTDDVTSVSFYPMGVSLLLGQRIAQSSCGMLRHGQILPRLKGIRMMSLPCHFRPMGVSLLLGLGMTQSSYGTLSRRQTSLHLQGMRATSLQYHFHLVAESSLLGPGMIQSNYGTLSRGQILPRLKDIGVMSIQYPFHPVAESSLLGEGHGIAQSSCGMLSRGQTSLRLQGIGVGSLPCHFHPMGLSSLLDHGMTQSNCGICRCISPLLLQPLHPTLMAMELLALPIFCSLSNSLDSVGVLRDMKRDST